VFYYLCLALLALSLLLVAFNRRQRFSL